jgi:hypothetical protein
MTAINADMTSTQTYVPLTAGNAAALASGTYVLGTEQVEVLDKLHYIGSHKASPRTANGRMCRRAVGGSTAATHSSGATLAAAYTGGVPTLAQVLAAGSDSAGGLFSTNAGVPGSTFITPLRLDSTNKHLYVWNGTSYTKVSDYA